MNITIKQIVNDFKETTLWSNYLDEFSIYDFDQQTTNMIQSIVESFIQLLNLDQINALTLTGDYLHFGHWLALEMQGHGSGFFDSNCKVVNSISDTLKNNFKKGFEPPLIDDGLVKIDFYTIK